MMLHAIYHLSASHFVLAHDGHPFGLILYAVPDLPLSYRNRLSSDGLYSVFWVICIAYHHCVHHKA